MTKLTKKILIVTSDLQGPIENGGVGTVCKNLAELFSEAGHQVEILFAPKHFTSQDFSKQKANYYKKNIRLTLLGAPAIILEGEGPAANAYSVYMHIQSRCNIECWDLIFFQDMQGLGYFCFQEKKTLGSFQNQLLVCLSHGPSRWHRHFNQELCQSINQLEEDFLEKASIELADLLVLPSIALESYLENESFRLPQKRLVLSYPIIIEKKDEVAIDRKEIVGSRQSIAFLNRLEYRKGLDLFIEALLLLPIDKQENTSVFFLGKNGMVNGTDGLSFIDQKLSGSKLKYHIQNSLTFQEAHSLLRTEQPLTVFAPRAESMGCAFLECVSESIDVLSTRNEAFEELLALDSQNNLIEHDPMALSEAISHYLSDPKSLTKLKLKNSQEELQQQWLKWVESLEGGQALRPIENLKISVCIASYNRPEFLSECLDSLSQQTVPPLEIWIGDDCSEIPVDESLELSQWQNLNIKIFRSQANLGPASIRNHLAELAGGEFILFMDDDNLAHPDQIEKFARAQLRTGADILVCPFLRFFESHEQEQIWICLGGGSALGFFYNSFGDMNSLIRKTSFIELGKLATEKGIFGEDWEFFARASLKNSNIQLIPEPLFHYRSHDKNLSKFLNSVSVRKLFSKLYANNATPEVLEEILNLAPHSQIQREKVFNSEQKEDSNRGWFNFFPDRSERTKWTASDVKVKMHGNIDIQKNAPAGFDFQSFSSDPQFFLSGLEFKENETLFLELQMTSSEETEVDFYFQTKQNPEFSEDNKKSFGIKKGYNLIQVQFPNSSVGLPRIDPLGCPGSFSLHQLEFCSSSTANKT